MKKTLLAILVIISIFGFAACSKEKDIEYKENKTVISGEFTVAVRDVIPDYMFDDSTPQVAIVTVSV